MKYLLISACVLGLVPVANAGDINVTFSEEFAEKLQKELGEREGVFLTKELTKDIHQEFDGVLDTIGDINVTIIDAKANRPTFKELGDTPGLSFQSIAIGGASLEGEILDVDGNVITSLDYKYFESDIRFARGSATWTDAKRSFNRFADRLEKKFQKVSADTGAGS